MRALSTPWYYDFCKEIIDEVVDVFDKPPLFHIGMDEENYHNQQDYSHVVVRQNDLWWHDFYYLVDLVEKNKSRAWIWSDFMWDNPEAFLRKMPKTVLQSNWYYGRFTPSELDGMGIKSYSILEANGYDQVPTGSNWECSENFGRTVEFGASSIAPERLKGFLQTSWKPTLIERKYRHLEAIDVVAQAKKRFYL